MERYYICRITQSLKGRGFNVSVRFKQKVLDELLAQALHRTIAKIPQLAVNAFRVRGDADEDAKSNGFNYEVRHVTHIDYNDVVQHRSVARFDGGFLRELSEVLITTSVEKPSWQFWVVDEEETGHQWLTFVNNHMFFDGTSGTLVMEELARALDASENSPGPFENRIFLAAQADLDLPEPSDRASSILTAPWGYTISKIFWALFEDTWVYKVFKRLFFKKPLPEFPRSGLITKVGLNPSTFHLVKFNSEETKRVLAQCKQEGVSFTSKLGASMCQAISQTWPEESSGTTHSYMIDVCGRRYLPSDFQGSRVGLYALGVDGLHAADLLYRAMAELYQKTISEGISTSRPFWLIGLLRYVNLWKYLANPKADRKTIEISNLGRTNIQAGAWTAQDIVFSQGVTMSLVCASVATTPGGITIVLAFHDELAKYGGLEAMEQCAHYLRGHILGN